MINHKARIRWTIFLLACAAAAALCSGLMQVRQNQLDAQLKKELAARDWPKAARTAESLAWYRPADGDLIFKEAELAARTGRLIDSARILTRITQNSPRAAEAAIARGLIFRDTYQFDDAELAFKEALVIDQHRLEARRAIAGILGLERRAKEQLGQLWAWQKSGSGSVEPLRLIAQSVVLIPPGTLAKTMDEGQVLEKALENEPDSPHLRPALARFYRNRGEVTKALVLLEDWLKTHPQDTAAIVEQLGCLIEMGDDARVTALLERQLPELRQESEFWLFLGDFERNRENWRKALDYYQQSIRLNPLPPETYYRMAECRRALGEGAEAAKLTARHDSIRKLAELAALVDPAAPAPEAMMYVARACHELDRPDEAAAWASEVLKLQSDNAEARRLAERVSP